MRNFHKIGNIDVAGVNSELAANPSLWGRHSFRTSNHGNPFYSTEDIWVRYRPFDQLQTPSDYLTPHIPEFYPAWDFLPSLHPIVFSLMASTRAVSLGGILITRKQPNSTIAEHSDRGSWHAEYHDAKLFLCLSGGEGCTYTCGVDSQVFLPGEVWTFNNLLPHSVIHTGPAPQTVCIICCRTASGNFLNMKSE